MVFSSTVFLFLFLPVVLSVNLLLRRELRNVWLLVTSLFFYSWGETYLVYLLLTSIVINYICGLFIANGFRRGPLAELEPNTPRTRTQKAGLIVSIAANLLLLGYFKYFNFGVGSYNSLVGALGIDGMQWVPGAEVALPLGISFFTFQAMSYTIDVYLGHTRATRNLLNFATYVSLFPQLVAGPIVRYSQVAEELISRTISLDGFAEGVRRFIIGLGKKMIIANAVALPADQIFGLPDSEITTSLAWFAVLCYTLQIYFDFSGYSDMAIGLGLMFGFHYPENFNYPYIAQSIREFWRRWHISLSTWFRDYLYIPLGGNRKSAARTHFNLVTVFFLCGLWHGASWTFVVWGLYHGFFLVLERTRAGRLVDGLWQPVRHGYTLLVVMLGWLIFRSETFGQVVVFLKAMAGFAAFSSATHPVAEFTTHEVLIVLALGVIGSAPWMPAAGRQLAAFTERMRPVGAALLRSSREVVATAFLMAVLAYSAMLLSAQTHNPFIYFRF